MMVLALEVPALAYQGFHRFPTGRAMAASEAIIAMNGHHGL